MSARLATASAHFLLEQHRHPHRTQIKYLVGLRHTRTMMDRRKSACHRFTYQTKRNFVFCFHLHKYYCRNGTRPQLNSSLIPGPSSLCCGCRNCRVIKFNVCQFTWPQLISPVPPCVWSVSFTLLLRPCSAASLSTLLNCCCMCWPGCGRC